MFAFLKGYTQENFVLVEGGKFWMGNDYSHNADEKPEHEVTISSFYMSKYEVTVQEYYEFQSIRGGLYPDGNMDTPIRNIKWIDAVMYCNYLSSGYGLEKYYSIKRKNGNLTVNINQKSNGFRLPTEAEWEFATKGGGKSKYYAYSGSSDIDEVAWYRKNSKNTIHIVGLKKCNELGIYDMSGNVSEWCYDWYEPKYYQTSPAENPAGPSSGISKVCRGGNYMCRPDVLRNSRRFNLDKSSNEGLAGIRLIKNE